MTDRAPYSRVYWSVMHDEKFDEIRHDCKAMGAWLLLLLQADMSWPSPAYIPRPIPKSALVSLANARIIELLSGHRYRIVGLDNERNARAGQARDAAAVRWQSERNATASGLRMPSKAKPSLEEQSLAEDARDVVDDYYRLTNRFPNGTVKEWLERLSNEFGDDAASRELANQYRADPNTRTLLGRVENELKSARHIASKKQAAAEKARLEEWARTNKLTPEQAADNQRRIKELMRDWLEPGEAA